MTGVTLARVLVGVDFDEASAAALELAASLAAPWGAGLTVFHAASESVPAYFTADQIEQLEAERAENRAAVAAEVRAFAAQHVPGTVSVVVEEGLPQDAMVRLAPGFDLVAIGTHRRHGLQRWWLGSVAEAIVRRSPRPVLVVPAGGGVPAGRRPTILAAGAGDDAAGPWIDLLRASLDGIVVQSPDLDHCPPDRVRQADLIVLPMPDAADRPRLSAMARVLEACAHPVLFVPASETAERSLS